MIKVCRAPAILKFLLLSLWTIGECALATDFAHHPDWLHLLHFDSTKVRSQGFYLSNPIEIEREFKLNLERAQVSPEYQCQFPARARWLRKHFRIAPSATCPELNNWRKRFTPSSISIVYPNHSLESPLAVFSHTFLKFNSYQLPLNSNLNLAVGFGADFSPDDSLVKLAALGVTGGYTGRFTLTNYYSEVNRYGEGESRDIFEYELNLTQAEVDLLFDHIWEIKDAEFRYYFFSGNCSFYLLTLLEVARPNLKLSSHFHFLTIPLTSLKVVLAQSDLIRSRHFLASKQTRIERLEQNLTADARKIYEDQKNLASLSAKDQIAVLDLLSETAPSETLRQSALVQRSELPPEPFIEDEPPHEWPENSHGPHLLSFGAGRDADGDWLQLRSRLVLHNLLDPLAGYFRNTTLEVGDVRLRYGTQKFSGSSLTLINLLIVEPWAHQRRPLSWLGRSTLDETFWHNEIGVGLTQNFAPLKIYTLAIAQAKNDQPAFGASLGTLIELKHLRMRANLDHLWAASADYWRASLQSSCTLATDLSLQVEFTGGETPWLSSVEVVRYF